VKRKRQFQTRSATAAPALVRREFAFDRRSIDEEARTVELSFSSEAEVDRGGMIEILDHAPSSVRLGRLQNGGPFLMDHNRRDQVGVVESVSIGDDRMGRARIRFSRSARGQEIFQDIVDGIRRLVSVGYRIHRTETSQRAGGVVAVRVTDWEPYEVSLVSIPADETVGVGRSDESQTPAPSEQNRNLQNQMNTPENQESPAAAAAPAPAAAPETRAAVISESPSVAAQNAVTAERSRVGGIHAIAEQVRANGVQVDANAAIASGVTVEAFRQTAFDQLLARQSSFAPGAGGADLSRSEQRDLSGYSITRGLATLLQGQQLTGIEAEMQQEAQREARAGGFNLAGNFSIPAIALAAGRRDMSVTGGSNGDQGGTLVPTTQGAFIDLLYSRQVLRGLGAQFLTGLTGNIEMPKFVTGATAANKSENGAGDESNPTTGLVTLSPKRATTFVEISRQLMLQGNPSAEALVRNDLATIIALLMEARAINGTGDNNQPTGILATNGIGSVAGGTHGAAPTWANIIGLETEVAIDNADTGSLGYLTNTKVRGKLKGTSKVSGQNGFIWEGGTTPLNGYNAAVTNQVPSNLEKGDASTCSAIIFGNFADLIVALWGGIDIMANPYSKDTEGLVRLTVNAYHDVAVRRAESFAAMKDALTA